MQMHFTLFKLLLMEGWFTDKPIKGWFPQNAVEQIIYWYVLGMWAVHYSIYIKTRFLIS